MLIKVEESKKTKISQNYEYIKNKAVIKEKIKLAY